MQEKVIACKLLFSHYFLLAIICSLEIPAWGQPSNLNVDSFNQVSSAKEKIEILQEGYFQSGNNHQLKDYLEFLSPILAKEIPVPESVLAHAQFYAAESKRNLFDFDGVEELYSSALPYIEDKSLSCKAHYQLAEEMWFKGRYKDALRQYVRFAFTYPDTERRILMELACIEAIPTILDELLKEESSKAVGLFMSEIIHGESMQSEKSNEIVTYLLTELGFLTKNHDYILFSPNEEQRNKMSSAWRMRFEAQRLYHEYASQNGDFPTFLKEYFTSFSDDIYYACRNLQIVALRLYSNAASKLGYALLDGMIKSPAYIDAVETGIIPERISTQIRFNHAILTTYAGKCDLAVELLKELMESGIDRHGSVLNAPVGIQNAYTELLMTGVMKGTDDDIANLVALSSSSDSAVRGRALIAFEAIHRRQGIQNDSLLPKVEAFAELKNLRKGDHDCRVFGEMLSDILAYPDMIF